MWACLVTPRLGAKTARVAAAVEATRRLAMTRRELPPSRPLTTQGPPRPRTCNRGGRLARPALNFSVERGEGSCRTSFTGTPPTTHPPVMVTAPLRKTTVGKHRSKRKTAPVLARSLHRPRSPSKASRRRPLSRKGLPEREVKTWDVRWSPDSAQAQPRRQIYGTYDA